MEKQIDKGKESAEESDNVPRPLTIAEMKQLVSDTARTEATLIPFRSESDATKVWRDVSKTVGAPFLRRVLAPLIEKAHHGGGAPGHRFRLSGATAPALPSPSPPASPGQAIVNVAETPAEKIARSILELCFRSIDHIHMYQRELLRAVAFACASDDKKRRLAVRNLFFLRFISCGCVDLVGWGAVQSSVLVPQSLAAAVCKALGAMVSDANTIPVNLDPTKATSPHAVQIFLDRVVDVTLGASNPLDLRHHVSAAAPQRRVGAPCAGATSLGSPEGGRPSWASKRNSQALGIVGRSTGTKREEGGRGGSGVRAFPKSFIPAMSNWFGSSSSAGDLLSPKIPAGCSLRDLSVDGVSQLLFAYHMTELIEIFRERGIDGARLATMTDREMQHTFGIARSTLRRRLAKVIELNDALVR